MPEQKAGSLAVLILAAVFAVVLTAAAARADIIWLKGGGKLEGVVVADTGTQLKVRTAAGEIAVDKSKVDRIEKKATPTQEVEEKLKALDPDDAEGHFELALYCRKHGLRKQEADLYRKVLAIDDQHPGANQAVGNVEHDGRWMTPAERDRRVAEAEAAGMREKGLVEHEGRWVTPEEKANLEKGLVFRDGRWMTADEVKRADGFVPYKGGWIRKDELDARELTDRFTDVLRIEVKVSLTPHFAVVGTYDDAELKILADAAEATYRQFGSVFAVDPRDNLVEGREEDEGNPRCLVLYTKKALDYVRFVDWMMERYPQDMPASRANLMKQQKGFYFVYPGCYVAGYQFPNTFQQVRASIVHKLSHVLLQRVFYTGNWWPWWLIEGLGTWQEIALLGQCDTYCITDQGYGVQGGDPAQKWAGLSRWKEVVKSMVTGLTDPSLIELSKKGLNELDFRDLAKCWSLCEWLIAQNRDKFVRLVQELKAQKSIVEATEGAFGISPEQLDKQWRDYVRANY
ncbi:MAG: hypothetical protein MUE73_04355 [Planctomycetes bacterium]|jgi:hypothetical protein|nr:hypothetical protein [Planctomycetota bacterium]